MVLGEAEELRPLLMNLQRKPPTNERTGELLYGSSKPTGLIPVYTFFDRKVPFQLWVRSRG